MRELDYTKMGMRIRQLRKAKGWSQDALAKKCGISMSFLGHIERGSRIMSLETFVSICGALGTGADELLWGVAHPSDSLLDLWGTADKGKQENQKEREDTLHKDGKGLDGKTGGRNADSYSLYVRIMKSVAEIMNER